MRVGLGIDQLDIDAYLATRATDASFQHIAHAELTADLLRIYRLVSIGKGSIARDHEHVGEPRQIGREVVGDPIGKILLTPVLAEIREGQHNDRQTWSRDHVGVGSRRRHNKTVSASGYCLNAAAPEAVAQVRNLDGQVAVFDRLSAPDGLHDLLSLDQSPPAPPLTFQG